MRQTSMWWYDSTRRAWHSGHQTGAGADGEPRGRSDVEQMLFRIDAGVIAFLFAIFMATAWALGNFRGRRLAVDPDHDPGSKVVDAALAVFGLLLAFTFAMTLERHEHRRLMLVSQANAIGDFFTCATIIPPPERTELQAAIRRYAQYELDALRDYTDDAERRRRIAQSMVMHNAMTEIASRAIERNTPIALALTNTLNDVTSTHASRTADYEERLPWPVQMMLLAAACGSTFLLGRQQGLAAKKCIAGTVSFILLVSLVIFVVKDLSQPRRGWIKVNTDPMARLVESIKE